MSVSGGGCALLDGGGSADPQLRDETRARLEQYLRAYWLRPENAFWMTLRSVVLTRCRLNHPSADLSCGDGIFSFIHAGGRFAPGFDVFAAVGSLEAVTDGHADMFDAWRDNYVPPVVTEPDFVIDIGSDCKPTMLRKAAALKFYRELVEHDNNRPLPFEDGSLATVYCNAAYWVTQIDAFLAECRRVTCDGGRIILHVKLSDMERYSVAAFGHRLGQRAVDIIGRGRVQSWPSLASRRQWEDRFRRAGLEIIEATPFVTPTHAHIWDVGLRPIAPMLVRMANALTPATRADIKRDWVALFMDLLSPICDPTFDLFPERDEPAEIQYVLTPAA